MADLKILNNLKYIGYVQDSRGGRNGQFLRLRNGIASWATLSEDGANILVTVPSSKDVLIDKNGDAVHFTSENVYSGIDTKPFVDFSTEETVDVEFINSQEEYDTHPWEQGEAFIPTIQGIEQEAAASVVATYTITVNDPIEQGAQVNFLEAISTASNTLFNASTIDFTFFGLATLNSSIPSFFRTDANGFQARVSPISFTTANEIAEEYARLFNTISIDPANPTVINFSGGSIDVVRRFEARADANLLVLQYLTIVELVEPVATTRSKDVFGPEIFEQSNLADTEDFVSVENALYIRRRNNNGWLQFGLPSREFITGNYGG